MKVLAFSILSASLAGFVGGVAAQSLWQPTLVRAQTARIEPPDRPFDDRAQAPRDLVSDRFLLTDAKGHVRGEFKMEKGNPEIVMYDSEGKVIWKAPAPGGPRLIY